MAPAQQLMKVHHPGGVGVAEPHGSAEQQPAGGIHGQGPAGAIDADRRQQRF
jgi:hypothetical protein